jgi:hypothetical protein
MRLSTLSLAEVTASRPIPLSRTAKPIETSYAVIKAGGGDLTYSVQYTVRDVLNAYSSANVDWFDLTSGRTISFSGSMAFPANAVRLLVTAVSGSATAEFMVLQGGD